MSRSEEAPWQGCSWTPIRGLPDPEHEVLDRYGQEFRLLKLGRMPAQVIVDRRGVIRWAHYGDSMSDIPENDEILGILADLAKE